MYFETYILDKIVFFSFKESLQKLEEDSYVDNNSKKALLNKLRNRKCKSDVIRKQLPAAS